MVKGEKKKSPGLTPRFLRWLLTQSWGQTAPGTGAGRRSVLSLPRHPTGSSRGPTFCKQSSGKHSLKVNAEKDEKSGASSCPLGDLGSLLVTWRAL